MWPRLCWPVLCHEETDRIVEGFCRSRESILSAPPWRMSRLAAVSGVLRAKMKCQSRNPNPMTRLMLFPPSPFILLLSFSPCPSRSTKHGIFWRCFSCYPCCPVSIPISHLLHNWELFLIAVCLKVQNHQQPSGEKTVVEDSYPSGCTSSPILIFPLERKLTNDSQNGSKGYFVTE